MARIALMVVLGAPMLAAVLWFFETCGDNAWIYVWCVVAGFNLLMAFLAPVLILPIFLEMVPSWASPETRAGHENPKFGHVANSALSAHPTR